MRKLRTAEFGLELFGEPAWDMLLELYVREASGKAACFEDLQQALSVPGSVALRWLKVLQSENLITCERV